MKKRYLLVVLILLVFFISGCELIQKDPKLAMKFKMELPGGGGGSVPATCYDSDQGLDYFVPGYILNEEGIKSDDECDPSNIDSKLLLEYYCTENPQEPALGTLIECPGECIEGACEYSSCLEGECCFDSECNDELYYTLDFCVNQNDVWTNGSSAARCVNTQQLIGNRTLNTIVIEFAPQDVIYGTLYYCYNEIVGYYLQYSEEYCDNQISNHSFLELLNNPEGITTFNPLREVDEKNHYSLFYINDHLINESIRYGVEEIPNFNISIQGPFILSDLPPNTVGILNFTLVDSYFDDKIVELGIDTSQYDIVVVIYFNDYDILSDIDKHAFVSHNSGDKIYMSADTYRIGRSLYPHVMIHELLHSFNAGDHYVFGEGENAPEWCNLFDCCIDPEGVPNPGNYPQTKGCAMCAGGNIVIDLGMEQQTPENCIEDVIICKKTAEEIGWN